MILGLLFLLSFFQCLAYFVIDSYKIALNKLWIMAILILLYFTLIPYIFYQVEFAVEPQPRCGLPLMAMITGFWVVGGGLTIITHVSYYLLNRLLKRG